MKYIGRNPEPGEAIIYGYRIGDSGDFVYVGTTKTTLRKRGDAQRSDKTMADLYNLLISNRDLIVMEALVYVPESDRYEVERKVVEQFLADGQPLLNNIYTPKAGKSRVVANGSTYEVPELTHCVRGHEYTPENTYESVRASGQIRRECRICQRAQYHKNKELSQRRQKYADKQAVSLQKKIQKAQEFLRQHTPINYELEEAW